MVGAVPRPDGHQYVPAEYGAQCRYRDWIAAWIGRHTPNNGAERVAQADRWRALAEFRSF